MQHLHRVKFVLHPVSFLLLVAFFCACARQGAPAGGPKDTRPPGLDTLASTPNYVTRFDKKRIELKFDEWVVLSDVATQVVISPPLAKRPEVVLKGRTVVVHFDKNEVFRPNTTYTLNFGTAVKDLHEGNPAKDLRFVFSTGDFIDSLFFAGVLLDAFTGEPVENAAVMLYENFADSAVRKERPYYFSRTAKSGQYEFKNLRPGTFRVIAIEDGDQNLKWDGENERIAFRDSALVLHDSMRGLVSLKMFKNQPRFRLQGLNTQRYGLVKLGFSVPVRSFETRTLAPEGLITWLEKTPDSLMLWYDLPAQDTSWTLLFSNKDIQAQDAAAPLDSIPVKKHSRSEFLKNHRISWGDVAPPPANNSGRGKSLTPAPRPPAVKTVFQKQADPVLLPFNFPIAAFDTALWLLSLDSSRQRLFNLTPDSLSPRKLLLALDWKPGKTYKLTLLPGALTDFWGTLNTDTLVRSFNVLSEKQLGTISLTLEKIKPGTHYVIQLLNGTALEEERSFVAASGTKKWIFKHLQVASYTARLFEDLNGNGRWDTGDFKDLRQPEPVFTKLLDPLRANWELEASFSTEEIKTKKKKQ